MFFGGAGVRPLSPTVTAPDANNQLSLPVIGEGRGHQNRSHLIQKDDSDPIIMEAKNILNSLTPIIPNATSAPLPASQPGTNAKKPARGQILRQRGGGRSPNNNDLVELNEYGGVGDEKPLYNQIQH